MKKLIKKSLHLQVYEIVKEKIISGELEPGSRVIEANIAKELKISNSPIREGLRMLEIEKYLIRTPVGLIVNPMEFEELVKVHECRIALEPYAAFLAAERISKKNLKKLRFYLDEAQACYQSNMYNETIEYNSAFHNLISNSCGNDYLISMIDTTASLIVLTRVAEIRYYKREDNYFPEHEAILNAIEDRNSILAESLVRKHVEKDFLFLKENYKKIEKE